MGYAVATLGAGTPKPRMVNQLRVFDSKGKKVGKVVGIQGQQVQTALKWNRNVFVLAVTRDIFAGNVGGSLFFESTDCTGSSFMSPGFEMSMLAPVMVFAPGNTLYTPAADAVSQDIELRSFLGRNDEGEIVCSNPFPDTPEIPVIIRAVLPNALFNLDDFFTAPFEVR